MIMEFQSSINLLLKEATIGVSPFDRSLHSIEEREKSPERRDERRKNRDQGGQNSKIDQDASFS
jgi:hypothetical protein